MKEIQRLLAKEYKKRGYSETPQTLLIGAMEELGEVSRALLLSHCGDYKSKPGKESGDIAYEIGDTITYLLCLSNSLGIEPRFSMLESKVEK